jgi:hypothetical protein
MILDWFSFVAPDVSARLAAENMPALADPAVLLGPENAAPVVNSASPRITLVPLGGRLTKRAPATPPFGTPAYAACITQPWIYTDVQAWRADISGVQYTNGVPASDLAANWDYCSAMLYVLIQSLTVLGEGSWLPGRYEWIDSKPQSGVLGGFGRSISFWFEVYVPVLTLNLQAPSAVAQGGYGLVPDPTDGIIHMNYVGGSSNDAITITTPPTT